MAFYFNGSTPKKILYNGLNVAKLVYNGVVVWMSKVLATISGILPLTLTDCTGDDLVDYKIYGNSENVGAVVSKKSVGDLVTDASDINYGKYKIPVLTNSHTTNIYLNKPLRKTAKLPGGYTELQHIRGTGTQDIDIGCKMYNYSELELCFSFDEMQQDCSIFGSRTSSTTHNFEIASTATGYPIYLDFGNYNISRATYNNAVINTKYICTISKSLRAVYDENRTLLVRNTALISADNTTPSNARIFDTAGGFSANKLKGKVYYCKVWENGVLIRDMIPCKNPSNVVGMYDTVNDVFYSNAGTDSFIAGAEVETVYYTDYLDYENQKVVRNVDDNDKGLDTPVEESVVLSAVPTDEGTVTVDVDTEIAPSYAEVVYYKNDV